MKTSIKTLELHMNVGAISIGYGLDVTRHLGDREELDELNASILALSGELRPVISRDEYKTWVKCWKVLYNKLSDVIRLTKTYRDGYAEGLGGNSAAAIHPFRQADVHTLRSYARHLMGMRGLSRLVAEHSYQVNKKVSAE